jgi:acyl carrier protein
MEEHVAAIWRAALGIEEIGIDDNFFELGGNSLLGIGLINNLRKEFKLERLPAHILYEAPSVGALAEYIDQSQQETVVIQDQQDEGEDERRKEKLRRFKSVAEMELQ